jgi:hypothetical protein
MVHDLGHDRLNNAFHKNVASERALLHNDCSIQENYHVMLLFFMMREHPEINILESFSPKDNAEVCACFLWYKYDIWDIFCHYANQIYHVCIMSEIPPRILALPRITQNLFC